MKLNSKGQVPIIGIALIIIAIITVAVFATLTFAQNGNGIYNWFYDDVTSGTERTPGCTPKKYVVEMHGTLDLINDQVGFFNWEVYYLDSYINDISSSQLGIFASEYDAKICLYDVLSNHDAPKKIDCQTFDGKITKGQISKEPFVFRYDLYDNDCNGVVDDHTFNLVTTLQTEKGFEKNEKTVAIIDGQTRFQNVKYD